MSPIAHALELLTTGCVITHTYGGWNVGGLPISDSLVYALLRRGWAYATRTPGGDLTGRLVIAARGRRALRFLRPEAA